MEISFKQNWKVVSLFVLWALAFVFLWNSLVTARSIIGFLEMAPLYVDRIFSLFYFCALALAGPILITFWARVKGIKKPYFMYLGLFLAYVAYFMVLSFGCSGEGCMIWMFLPFILIAPTVVFVGLHIIGWVILKVFKIDNFAKLLWVLFAILFLIGGVFVVDRFVLHLSNSYEYHLGLAIESEDPSECNKILSVLGDEDKNSDAGLRCLSASRKEVLKEEYCDKIKGTLDVTFYYACLNEIITEKGDLQLCDKIAKDDYKSPRCRRSDEEPTVKTVSDRWGVANAKADLFNSSSVTPDVFEFTELKVPAGDFSLRLDVPKKLQISNPAPTVFKITASKEMGNGVMIIQYNSLSTFDPMNYMPFGAKLDSNRMIANKIFYKYFTESIGNYGEADMAGFPYTVYAINSGEGMFQIEIYGDKEVTEAFEEILLKGKAL